jgi:hypothetical protein
MIRPRVGSRWRLLIASLGIAQICAAATMPEYLAKAAFLYKFATYVRWPASAGTSAGTPFVIGVMGQNPFGSSLKAVVSEQTVQGRTIEIRNVIRIEEALQCDVLFVSASERGNLLGIFEALQGMPTLTVGDMERFAEQGGMIGLITTEDRHIRFDINKAALERAGLRASSQLLQLARIVTEDGEHR